MDKQVSCNILRNLLKYIIVILKLIFLLVIICWFILDFIFIYDYNIYFVIFYIAVMLTCLFSYILSFFNVYKKSSYRVLGIFGVLYMILNFVSPASDKLAIDHCLDSGKGVWDYNERRCRTDCWKWDDKLGCLKE